MMAAVLAGGFGTRIQPLTATIPKPMLPVVNRPMIEYVLDSLDRIGVQETSLLLYYMPEKIRDYFNQIWEGSSALRYIVPDADYGTAGSVKFAFDRVGETFFVVSGDLVTDIDLEEVLDFHRRSGAMVTLTLTPVANPLQFGVVIAGEDGRIRNFLEKPGWGEVVSDTINTGIYVLEPEVLDHIPEGVSFDFSRDLFPRLMALKKPLFGHVSRGYWRDVGNPESYRNVHRDIFAGRTHVPFPGKRLETESGTAWIGEGSTLSRRARIKGTLVLGAGVSLPAGVYSNSVIGDGSEIGTGSHIESCVIWSNVSVGRNCRLTNTVLCDNVRMGDGASIPEGAIIASDTVIEEAVSIVRDVMLWPGKLVEAGSVLSSNLIWGDRWRASLFEGNTISGHTNQEMNSGFTAKLGEAFGSLFRSGDSILVSRDGHKSSRMLKRSFLGGVLSTGVSVRDLRHMPLPVTRYKLTSFGEVAGVHFRQKPGDETSTEILFFNSEGYEIGEESAKDIERIFFRENFRRSHHNEVGTITEMPLALDYYREHFLKSLDAELVRKRKFKVVLDLANGASAVILPDLMNHLGCETVIINAHSDETKLAASPTLVHGSLKQVGKIVRSLKADMGFYVAPSGERMFVVDDRGRVWEDHQTILFLMTLEASRKKGRRRVFLPVMAPLTTAASIQGLTVDTGRLSRLSQKEYSRYDLIADLNGRYAFTRFGPHADGMFSIAATLETLAESGGRMSAAFDSLPAYGFSRSDLVCPPDQKGLVMRNFRQAVEGGDVSYDDGIKVHLPEGWAMLLPDAFGPRVTLFVESTDAAAARKLMSFWKRRVRRWTLQR